MGDSRCDLLCLDLELAEQIRERLDDHQTATAAARAKALGDRTRLTIALALREADELCVCDLAWITARAENLVSHHARRLRSLGLARSRRDAKMVLYSLTDDGRAMLAAIMQSTETTA